MGSEISEEEAEEILRGISEGKHSVHNFLNNVAKTKDTTKVGYLKEEEIGTPRLPTRTYKELAIFSDEIADEREWRDYFNKMSEVLTSTSLSKDGFLIKAAITTKKELADVSPQRKENRGWFKKKGSSSQDTSQETM